MLENDVMAELDRKLTESNMRGQWKSEAFLSAAIGGPKPGGEAAVWHWDAVMSLMSLAGESMPESLQARRSLIFQNPGLPRGTSHTINMGVQMILPEENAWAHRHSIGALRFIIEGDEKLTTIVDGNHCVMQTGDLVLTPNWSWHDHHNQSGKPAYWLDVLDVPLVLGLNQVFYEPGTAETQPIMDHDLPRGVLRFPWNEAIAGTLSLEVDPELGQCFEYRDPKTGGSCLPTLSCRLVRLPPAFAGALFRTTASSVGFVVRGAGRVHLPGSVLEIAARDAFVIPNWTWHHVSNSSPDTDMVIFMVTDEPVIKALGFLRRESAA